ncbi:MAG: NosD domain-containing protein, partial [Candidatus Aerophobetes bacterium]|nr:NosD domain-containing protein [Candidatus Aerophobetes bacterium]
MNKIKLFSLLIPCLLILISGTAVSATTIYVSDDYLTIQEAINGASSGDTVVVRDGTYTENVVVNKDHLTVESENGAPVTIIEAVAINDSVFTINTDYVTIQGFTAKRGCSGIYLIDADYCSIFDNITSSNSDKGIYLVRSSSNTLNGNTASDNSYGISLVYSSNNNLIYNTASDNSNDGIYLATSSDSNTLNGNTASDNSYGISLVYSSNNRIWFNNFTANHSNIFLVGSTNTVLSSAEEITYTYNSNTYISHLGNYWDNYTGEDADNNGIGDTPYT